jgi:hypothetical protein
LTVTARSAHVRGALERLRISAERKEVVERAEQGDQTALPELRQALTEVPELWQRYGDMGRWAEEAWVRLAAGENLMQAESAKRELDALKAELTGPETPTPLEKLLIDRIVIGWFQVHYADAFYVNLQKAGASPARLRAALQLLDRSSYRYLSSIKQLALVRKLLKPTVSFLQIATHLKSTIRKTTVKRDRCTALANGVGIEN